MNRRRRVRLLSKPFTIPSGRRITVRAILADPNDDSRILRLACYYAIFHLRHTPQPERDFADDVVAVCQRAIRGEAASG